MQRAFEAIGTGFALEICVRLFEFANTPGALKDLVPPSANWVSLSSEEFEEEPVEPVGFEAKHVAGGALATLIVLSLVYRLYGGGTRARAIGGRPQVRIEPRAPRGANPRRVAR